MKNLLKKKCPHCSESISMKQIKQYIAEDQIDCPYCRKTLSVKASSAYFNSVLLGVFIGVVLGAFMNVSTTTVVVVAMCVSLSIQSILEFILLDLKVVDDIY